MKVPNWCEHDEKISKYVLINYDFPNKIVTLRLQSWFCPECGVHGAISERIEPIHDNKELFINDYQLV